MARKMTVDREPGLREYRILAQTHGVLWHKAVMRWHAVDSFLELPASTLAALADGSHPFFAVSALTGAVYRRE